MALRRFIAASWARFDDVTGCAQAISRASGRWPCPGTFRVVRGRGRLRNLAASLSGLPQAGEDVPVRLEVVVKGEPRALESAAFPASTFTTLQWADGELLMERSDRLVFSSTLVIDGPYLRYRSGEPGCWAFLCRSGFLLMSTAGWRRRNGLAGRGAHLRCRFWARSSITKGGSSRNERPTRVVSVLGGYGIFGGRVAEALARDASCRVRVVGRNAKIGGNFAQRIGADFHAVPARGSRRHCGAHRRVVPGHPRRRPVPGSGLSQLPSSVWRRAHITSTWPMRAISSQGSAGSTTRRQRRGLLVASGVSSTPAITSAMIAELPPEFARIEEIHAALSPGNQEPARGARPSPPS